MAASKRRFPDPRPLSPPRACGACGQDLSGQPLDRACPACGRVPSVRCVTCGYELTGLDTQDPCPECATPIAESIRGDGLAFAAPAHLRTLDRGLVMVRSGVGLVLITWLGVMLALIVVSASGVQISTWVEDAIMSGLMLASLVLYVAGWLATTTPDPRTPEGRRPRSAAIARYGAVAILAAVALLLVLGGVLVRARDAILPALLVLALVQHGCASVYLRHLSSAAANGRARRYATQAAAAVLVVAIAWAVDLTLGLLGVQQPAGMSKPATLGRLAFALIALTMPIAAIVAVARQFGAAGLLRDDLRRFLFAKHDPQTQQRPGGR
ncbi:MAG: hypothetical protein ACIAS6_13470 [Phycisphaerales bacterium JB060]